MKLQKNPKNKPCLLGRAVCLTFDALTLKVTFTSLEKAILIFKTDAFELGPLSWKAS